MLAPSVLFRLQLRGLHDRSDPSCNYNSSWEHWGRDQVGGKTARVPISSLPSHSTSESDMGQVSPRELHFLVLL